MNRWVAAAVNSLRKLYIDIKWIIRKRVTKAAWTLEKG